ncbi:hypothetical protein WCLP8_1700008 [uncultured Gammaproteobacteria bacterium]
MIVTILADAFFDLVVRNACKITLRGESLRFSFQSAPGALHYGHVHLERSNRHEHRRAV